MQTTSFVDAVRVLAQEYRSRLLNHPASEELVAYWSGDLPAQKTEDLREHLALCSECCQALLDLASFVDPDPAPNLPSSIDLGVERAWRSIRSRLALESTLDEAAPRPRVAPSSLSRWAAHLAAVLLLAVLALSGWNIALRRQLDERLRPIPNVAVIDLIGPVRGEPVVPQVVAGDTVFLLHPEREFFPEYEAEILRGERALYRLSDLRIDGDGNLTLMMSRYQLTPGRYRVRLMGRADLRRVDLGSYQFFVSGSEAGSKVLRGSGV